MKSKSWSEPYAALRFAATLDRQDRCLLMSRKLTLSVEAEVGATQAKQVLDGRSTILKSAEEFIRAIWCMLFGTPTLSDSVSIKYFIVHGTDVPSGLPP